MKEQPLKYSLIFVYNQLAVCLSQPQGFKVLAICRICSRVVVSRDEYISVT